MKNLETKMKIVWICHFNNAEVEAVLKPYREVGESAPWITDQIKIFEEDDRFDLYVISPYKYITGVRNFKIRGVNYIFYNSHMPIIGRSWPALFKWDYISDFFTSKKIVSFFVRKINPDIIHLQTAENAYVSSTILPLIGKYPIISGVQGFISQAKPNNTLIHRKKVQVEKEIFENINHVFYRTEKMKQDLLGFNKHLKLFPTSYPIHPLDRVDYEDKTAREFDIVFFARVTQEKGIMDLIDALETLKKQGNEYTLCIIGGGNKDMVLDYARGKGVEQQITWKGFLKLQRDVYREVVQCRISVLPTHYDIIPGTIIQSMFLKLPVVSYGVGSIPTINEQEEYIKIVPKHDIEGLANEIACLLSMTEDDRVEYAEKARARAVEMFIKGKTDEDIINSLLLGYQTTIDDFRKMN